MTCMKPSRVGAPGAALFILLTAAFLVVSPDTAFAQGTTSARPASPAGQPAPKGVQAPLTLDEVILLALDSQPRLRAAAERVRAQRAVVGQAKSAYYPTINHDTTLRQSTSRGTDAAGLQPRNRYSIGMSLDWTIYDFGKREGSVRQQRDTLDSTRFAQRTSAEDVVLGVKQAYYRYLQATVVVRVREDTVKDRELLVRQAKGFFEVGTRPKIDVTRAESNLFLAQADLITAQNAVKVAWARLKNAVGLRKFPQRALVEEALLERPVEDITKELVVRPPPSTRQWRRPGRRLITFGLN